MLNDGAKACVFWIQDHDRQGDSGAFERNSFIGKSNAQIVSFVVFQKFCNLKTAASIAESFDHDHKLGLRF
ncbi:hypothetical protein D9M70_616490 [compost metagenome]